MCGICGLIGLSPKEDGKIFLDNMLKSLSYRGPDEEGKHFDEDVLLGIRRLSIIDLKTGSQPIYNEDKSIVLICNGEIYNFYILREKLIKKGHKFYTQTDTEVIIHLYEELGIDCLRELKGMFAFALWDKEEKLLFLARDRLGIKPLYYFNNSGMFAFASELKALLELPFITKILNLKAVDLYFSLEYVPAPLSIFKDIYKLKPGYYLTYKNPLINIKSYWNLDYIENSKNISLAEAEEKLKYLLEESIKEHLLSNVPLGIFLSGGIDSSTLTAFICRISSQRLNTFSIGFADRSFDESRYAQLVSHYFNTQHHHYIFTLKDLINVFPEVTKIMDEPLADLSIFPTYLLCKFSRQFVKVVLSGEGADELFMGYPTYRAHRYMLGYQIIPEFLRKFIITPLINYLPVSFEYFSLDSKLKQFLKGQFLKNPCLRHLLWMGSFSSLDKENLFNEELNLKREKSEGSLKGYIKSLFDGREVPAILKAIQYLDIFSYLSEDLLVKADRAGMASSLEIRVPYLDYKLVEFLWRLPSKLIFQKRLLKYSMRNDLPLEIIKRLKKGFAIPFSNWIRDRVFFTLIKELFMQDFIDRQNMFNYRYIKALLDEHISKKRDNRKKLRTYIMFQVWYRNYLS